MSTFTHLGPTNSAAPSSAWPLREAARAETDGTASALSLRESIELREGALDADGAVLLHVLRPCVGRGKGNHLYEADMLEREAGKFAGWKMYANHLSEAARKALQGLPRPVEHLGGRVLESWWDADVPAEPDKGYGQGAVVARVKPVGVAKDIIEQDPALIEASINARATKVRPVQRDGRQVWLVEGIRDGGSIDWVTDGGAGGRVAQIVESGYHRRRDEEMTVLETLSDTELLTHLRADRPELIEKLAESREPAPEPEPPRPAAEVLREALDTPEGREAVAAVVDERVRAETTDLREELDYRDLDARARDARQRHLKRLHEAAVRRVDEANLPPKAAAEVKARFALSEAGEPEPRLDLVDELDESGATVKTADERLAEAVNDEVARMREVLAESSRTRVRGQGGGEPAPKTARPRKPEYVELLAEAGIDEPEGAWDDPWAEPEPEPERKPDPDKPEEE